MNPKEATLSKSETRELNLSAHIVRFCRLLRHNGVRIGPAQQVEALHAISLVLPNKNDFRTALRITTVKTKKEQEIFDKCFNVFWNLMEDRTIEKHDSELLSPPSSSHLKRVMKLIDFFSETSESINQINEATYGSLQRQAHTDFAKLETDELEQISKLILLIGRKLARILLRRYRSTSANPVIDLRRTLRNSLHSGEFFHLSFLSRQRRRLKLALICDVSKSMDLYSRFLIQFMYAFQRSYRHIETYVFSTNLYKITEQLRSKNLTHALDRLKTDIPEWAGGTRIGESLDQYLRQYGFQTLDQRTIVIILSDGWETGDVRQIKASMREIQRRSFKVIWLNPLLGNPKYRPETRGMKAALPFIDIFATAHSVSSLQQLSKTLTIANRFI